MAQPDSKPSRRIPWLAIVIASALVLVSALSWWFAGRKVWTDDRGVAVVDSQAKLRQVLWSPPQALGDLFDGDQQHYEPSFSPDGTELYFVAGKPGHNADIYVSYRRNNQWSTPEPVAAVNTKYDELGPRVTANGKFLLFYSDRPGGFGGYDIWASPRTKEGWGKPFNLGPNVNSEFNEFTPDATPDGKHLIFATNRVAAKREQLQNWRATIRANEVADFDLWIAELQAPGDESTAKAAGPATELAAPKISSNAPMTAPADSPDSVATTQPTTAPALDAEPISPDLTFGPAREIPGINTPFVEGASCMSPAGDFLYFASNRPGGFGKFDIWRSRVSSDWKFGPVENAGAEINSADNETDPALAFNGYRLIFSSDRGSDTGVYRLFSSDSREVYAMRQSRPLPQLGLSFWLFLLSVLALIPLLLMLRGMDGRRLGILQRCLLISLLVHVLLCLGLSFVYVTHDVYHYARQQLGIEVAINLNPSPEMEVGTAIRRESTASDLPTNGAPPQAERSTQTPLETAIAPGPVDVSLPRASAQPEPVMAAAEVAHNVPPIKADSVTAQPTAPQAELPRNDPLDIAHAPALHAVSQAEARPQVDHTTASAARAAAEAPDIAPHPLPTPATPAARATPAPLAIEPGPVARPNLPAGGAADAAHVAPQVTPVATAAPNVSIPQATAAKVAGTDAAPTASTAAPTSATPSPLDAPAAHAIHGASSDVTPAAAPARPDASNTATPTIVAAGASHPVAGPVVEGAAAPGTSNLVSAPDVDAPKSAAHSVHVASGQPNAPQVQEASIGTARQGVALASANPTGVEVAVPRTVSSAASSVGGPVAPGVSTSIKAMVAGPTTLPSGNIAATISGPPGPQVTIAGTQTTGPRATEDRPLPAESSAGPAARPTGPIATAATSSPAGPAQVGISNAPSKPDASSAIASAPVAAPSRIGMPGTALARVTAPAAGIPDTIDGPKISLPQPSAALASPHPAAAGAGENSAAPTVVAMSGKQSLHGPEGGGTRNVSIDVPGPVVAGAHLPKEAGAGLDPVSARPRVTQVASSVSPKIDIGPLPTDIGTGRLNAPDSPFQLRAPEMHKPIIEKLGGNKESEDAVAKALFWLSENQEDNGRWTMVFDNRRGKHARSQHDTALTGLSILAFLAQDHRPDKPGPYRATVTLGLEYLLSAQRADGDLRGDSPGSGAAQSNMYDHGIASYAMAEAAILTHDPRYVQAALHAADFIVKAQNEQSGGWRYAPRESADTSVFGWQVMALHSAEQVGFAVPERTRNGINHYIEEATSGKHKMLASYQPRSAPTPTMTAQMAFSRMLLGRQLTDAEMEEAADFLARTQPSAGEADLYYWYYASLCMSQMQTPAWKSWNQKTRDALIAMQKPEGDHSGYWDTPGRKGENVGRVFSTAMGALTLEVYYRYMPLQERNGAPAPASTSAPK